MYNNDSDKKIMAQLMPLPLTISRFRKIQICFTFLVSAHPGSPRQRVCVCVCVCVCVYHCALKLACGSGTSSKLGWEPNSGVHSAYPRHLFRGMGESPPPQKKLTVPSNGCQVVCSKFFFCWRSELQIDHVEVLLVDNKHRKLFVVKQSKGCKFMSKCSIIRLAASPKPAGRAYVYRVAAVGAYV